MNLVNIRRKFLAILTLTAALLLGACAGEQQSAPMAVLSREAVMEADGRMCGVEYAARVTVGGAPDGGSRDLCVVYSAPDALAGLTVRREGGVWGAELGPVTVSGDAARLLALPAELFLLTGEVVFTGTESGPDGAKNAVFTLSGSEGSARITLCGEVPVAASVTFADGREVTMNVRAYSPAGAEN